jgi:hypothetical protein
MGHAFGNKKTAQMLVGNPHRRPLIKPSIDEKVIIMLT